MAIFDKEAKNYDQWYKSKLGGFVDRVETELALSLFKPTAGMRILDVGCGTGNFSVKLAEIGCKVVGIDISQEMLEVAKAKAKEKGLDIEFINMDVCGMKFSDEVFDGVFSMAAFEFIKEPKKAYEEMHRVLKKGGHMLIGTINLESQWGEFYISKAVRENSVFKYADFKTIDDMKSWDSENFVKSGECLFIMPNAEDKDVSMEREKELSATERGGFICVLWKKGV